MKRIVTIGLLGAVLAIAVGFIGTSAISANPFFIAGNNLSPNESAYMIGHVEYTVRGADGQIKAYVQGDNEIVDRGRDCSAQAIFNPAEDIVTPACNFSADGFSYIAIGNGTHVGGPAVLQLVDNTPGPGCDGVSTTSDTCEMQRVAGVVSIDTSNSGSTVVTVTNSATPFTFNHGDNNGAVNGAIAITESGLFDTVGIGSDNMFSVRPVTGVSVTNQDTLAVTWTITLS